jgi:hypothetical protein
MSARLPVLIKITDEQRNEIKEKLDKEITHVKIWVIAGGIVFAEPIQLPG